MPAVSRCRAARMNAAALVILIVSVSAASSAYAQESTPPPPAAMAPAAAPMPAARPLFDGTHFGLASSFGVESSTVFLAVNTGGITWGLGVNYAYDGNAVAGATNPGGDKTHASGVLSLGYMVHNQFPFAMGPEVNFIPELAPKGFDTNVLQVGWALWYAPFNIPAVIGTAAFVQTVFPAGGKAIVTTVTPAVRMVFGFH
jgi:hypothetical protein